MLAPGSLVIDLIFDAKAELEPTAVLDALGGPEIAESRQLVDPDMQDPRWELELTPSMPFRRRGERRLLLIDPTDAPIHDNPNENSVAEIDFRPEKTRLLAMCEALDVRSARIFGLGMWGSAVIAAKSAQDLRGLCLITWALDPSMDVSGRRRETPLARPEFEEKLAAYDKRLEELDEKQILENIGPAKFERHGDYLVLDVLDGKGYWDLIKSLEMEAAIAAVERFSVLPGAPQGAPQQSEPEPAADEAPASDDVSDETPVPPLAVAELAGRLLLLFPPDRFDRDVAAALGKKDWGSVIGRADPIGGRERDTLHVSGGDFVAPLEFLSEVFIEGTPLSRSVFDELAIKQADGTRTLEVHCPRFGQVVLIDMADQGRFISSAAMGDALQATIRGHYG